MDDILMVRTVVVICAVALMAGCAGPNGSISTLQFTSDVLPFPENYQVEAAQVVRDRGGDLSKVFVSYPRPTIGEGVLSPQRWYACLSGMPSPPLPTGRPLDLLFNPRPANRYDVVLVFPQGSGRASVRDGFDSPLCRDGVFEPITARPSLN